MLKQLKKEKLHKILITILLMEICLVSSVQALGVGPTHLDVTVEKGKEIEITRYVQVSNPDTNPLSITGAVTGSVSEFITLEPSEFDLPPGPGIMTTDPVPYNYVKVIIKVPREVSEYKYMGEILFTEKPITGGVLVTSAQLGVRVNLNIGKVAEAVFPVYINGMIFLLVILLMVSIFLSVKKKVKKK